jgi:DNA-binding transcriptional regulator YdaS (Cro superfamily)
MSTQVEIPAGSAPAIESVETPEVSVQERLDHATSAELDTWRKTGDIPAVKVKTEATPKPAESAPAEKKEEVKAKPDVTPAPKSETAAASPAAPPQKQESRSEKRWRELSEQFGDLKRKNEELERRLASQPAPEVKSEKVASPAATEAGKATEVKTDAEPEIGGINPKTGKAFQTIAEWQKEHTEWLRKQILAEVDGRQTKAEQARTQSEEERKVSDEVFNKSKSAIEKYPDFKEVAADPKLPIPKFSPVDLFIMDSDHPGEVLYYLGKHPEILTEFYGCKYDSVTKTWDYGDFDMKTGKFTNHVNPIRQVKRLEAIEREVSGEVTPAPKKEDAPAKPTPVKLPPPPTELSGRAAAAGDDAEKALQRGDFATWKRLTDARELQGSRR